VRSFCATSLVFRVFTEHRAINLICAGHVFARQCLKIFNQHRVGILPRKAQSLFGLFSKIGRVWHCLAHVYSGGSAQHSQSS
jgi:hypothetical protein